MSEDLSFASRIRKFFDDLFYSQLVAQLRVDLAYARQEADRVRLDKDQVIAELRTEKSALLTRIAMYDAKAGLRPPSQTPVKPNFGVDFSTPPIETSWQRMVREREEQIEAEKVKEKEAEAKAQTA